MPAGSSGIAPLRLVAAITEVIAAPVVPTTVAVDAADFTIVVIVVFRLALLVCGRGHGRSFPRIASATADRVSGSSAKNPSAPLQAINGSGNASLMTKPYFPKNHLLSMV